MTTRRQYLKALDELEGKIEKAYLDAIRGVVSRASVADIQSGVVAADLDAIVRSLRLDSAALSMVSEAIRETFITGGLLEAPSIRILFDVRSQAAEAWLSAHLFEFNERVTVAQREAIRVALNEGLATGRGPRQTALDIVGRIGPTGRRTGGIVGLSETQAGYVRSARAELTNLDSHYFTRSRRDRRFDSVVRRAIESGRPLNKTQVDAITGRYSDRLLQTRGNNIARTESIAALNAGREAALTQAVSEGDIDPRFVINEWQSTGDSRTRHAHLEMNGQRRPYGVPFDSPTGAQMMFPGDTSLGAGPEDVVNCRCFLRQEINFAAQAREREQRESA